MEKLIVCPAKRGRNNSSFAASIPVEEQPFIWFIKKDKYHPKSVTTLIEI